MIIADGKLTTLSNVKKYYVFVKTKMLVFCVFVSVMLVVPYSEAGVSWYICYCESVLCVMKCV